MTYVGVPIQQAPMYVNTNRHLRIGLHWLILALSIDVCHSIAPFIIVSNQIRRNNGTSFIAAVHRNTVMENTCCENWNYLVSVCGCKLHIYLVQEGPLLPWLVCMIRSVNQSRKSTTRSQFSGFNLKVLSIKDHFPS